MSSIKTDTIKPVCSRQISEKYPNIIFRKNPSIGS